VSRDAVAIVAMADNGVIGRGNGLPWHLPDDLKRFKALTMGHALLMGRRTYDSIGRALPRARAVGLTLFVIGGAEVFALSWPIVGRLELTEVHADVEGDTRLAGFDRRRWRETFRQEHAADERHAWPFSFVTLARR
jgi:dihydrofolate reductase